MERLHCMVMAVVYYKGVPECGKTTFLVIVVVL